MYSKTSGEPLTDRCEIAPPVVMRPMLFAPETLLRSDVLERLDVVEVRDALEDLTLARFFGVEEEVGVANEE